MANRAMDAKYKRAIGQRQALGMSEGMKPAYHTNKPLLREIAASAQHMVRNNSVRKSVREYTMVLYNPSIHREKPTLAMRCMVACDGELIRKADYLAG